MLENATLYLADSSLLGSKFFSRYREIQQFAGINVEGSNIGLCLTLSETTIRMFYMPAQDVPGHLASFLGYVSAIHEGSGEEREHLLNRIRNVRYVLGCTMDSTSQDVPSMSSFLLSFSAGLNGLLFMSHQIIDFDGAVVLGPIAPMSID